MKKEMNNKGFSLVELIVVIAIMAVLVGILAPQFLKYVEKSRLQKDNTAISEIANAAKTACAEEDVLDAMGSTAAHLSLTTLTGSGQGYKISVITPTELQKEMQNTLGAEVKISSKTYTNASSKPEIVITPATTGVSVSCNNYMTKPGATAVIQSF